METFVLKSDRVWVWVSDGAQELTKRNYLSYSSRKVAAGTHAGVIGGFWGLDRRQCGG